MSELLGNVVRFGRLLRHLGLETTTAEIHTLTSAWDLVDLRQRNEVKNAARAVLVHQREHLPIFDRAFDLFWDADVVLRSPEIDLGTVVQRGRKRRSQELAVAAFDGTGDGPEVEAAIADPRPTWSAREALRQKDFAELTDDEAQEIRRLMQDEMMQLPPRRTRRREPASNGPFLDLRAALRRNLRHGGEPIDLAWRRPRVKRRPLVVLCDISGSMEVYSRVLLQFIYCLRSTTDRLEAFVFGTRLTRITHKLRIRDVDRALKDATAAIVDWGGGTRIGESLKTFNYEHARRVLGQGAVVAVISDGWDRGDVDLLEREVQRLRRTSERLIWLNPLLGSPGYEPLTRGIQTVLPVVDDFLPVHNLASLGQLARLLKQL